MIRGLDAFGHPISLSYNKNPTFQSFFGGLMTIISRSLLLIYFLNQVAVIIQKSRFTISKSTSVRDLSADEVGITLNKGKFDIAHKLIYYGND